MSTYSAVLFDMDGTLVDSFPGIEAAVLEALERELPGVAHRFERSLVGPPIREIFNRALDYPSAEILVRLESAYRELYDHSGCLKSVLYPGVSETLRELGRMGIQSYIVTNKPKLPTTRILEALGLADMFVEVLSPDSVLPRFETKSAAAAHLVSSHGLDPETTMLVGDSVDDALAAQACDLAFVAARYGYGKAHLGAAYSIDRPDQLLTLLGGPRILR